MAFATSLLISIQHFVTVHRKWVTAFLICILISIQHFVTVHPYAEPYKIINQVDFNTTLCYGSSTSGLDRLHKTAISIQHFVTVHRRPDGCRPDGCQPFQYNTLLRFIWNRLILQKNTKLISIQHFVTVHRGGGYTNTSRYIFQYNTLLRFIAISKKTMLNSNLISIQHFVTVHLCVCS